MPRAQARKRHRRKLERTSARSGYQEMPAPEFDRDEILVCMVIAFCIAAASITTIYRVMGWWRKGATPMGRFFLFIIAVSIFLVLGTAVLVTYFWNLVSQNLARRAALSKQACAGWQPAVTGIDGRRAILPVSDCDTNASVRADI
jgi:hypothetical protein